MTDMLDKTFWPYMLGATAILYLVNWMLSRKKQTIYRISNDSLNKSKQVMVQVLSVVEDGKSTPIDERRLPYDREQIKSAAKILGYFYLKTRLPDDYRRVKNGFIALSRFQNGELDPVKQEARMKADAETLKREFELYIRRSPACRKEGQLEAITTPTFEKKEKRKSNT